MKCSASLGPRCGVDGGIVSYTRRLHESIKSSDYYYPLPVVKVDDEVDKKGT